MSSDENVSSVLKHDATMWRVLCDAMPLHVFIKNADDNFRYEYSNKTRNDFFGLSAEGLTGRNDMALLPTELAEAQLASDRDIMTKPQGIYQGLYEGPACNGQKRIFRIVQTQFTDHTGKNLLLGAAFDITEQEEGRRRLNEAKSLLEERERWLSRTLQSIGDGVIVTDQYGKTVLLNPIAEHLLGVQAKNVIGKQHEDVFHIVETRNHKRCVSPVVRVLRTGTIVELTNNTDLVSSDGTYYHVSSSAAPIMDEQKNMLGAVLVFRDVTETYQRRIELNTSIMTWEMASSVSSIASFRIDYRTRKILGSSQRLSEFWPIKDGYALHPEKWVLPEDIGNGQALMEAIIEGKTNHAIYKYRVRKDGKIRHYRIYSAANRNHVGELIGIVQDVTESYENEKELMSTRLMWNSLIDLLPLNFFVKNADNQFRYTLCNKRFAEFVGRSGEDVIGKTDDDLFKHPGDSAHFREQDIDIVKIGKSKSYTESVFGATKEPITYQSVKMPCIGPKGEQLLLGVSIDITELAMLNKSQEILRQGLEMLVSETDVNDGIKKAMKLVCEYMGVAHSYILHFNTEERTVSCVHEYSNPSDKNLLDNLKDKPYSTDVDWEKHFEEACFYNIPDLQNTKTLTSLGAFYTKLIKEGDFRSLYCHRLIIDGKFWGYVGLAYAKQVRILNQRELDFVQSAARFMELMIRHKRSQMELHDAVIQAQAAERAKSRFLATMSHEIRTPLNAVIGFSELLKDDTLSEHEKKDYLNDIFIAGNSLLALINDILDISKLEAGKMQFAKMPTNFSDIVQEIMIVFQPKFKAKHLEKIVDIPALPLIKIDPLRMRQILFNLIGNAVKFTDTGSITLAARFQPDGSGQTGTLRFSVKDTGCGISAEDKENLFQPFVQSSSLTGTLKAGCGSGLGLLLVRRMLEYMNGEITMESTLGNGSEFVVTLHAVEYTMPSALCARNANEPKSQQLTSTHRILLADDVPMNLKVLQAMLRQSGVESVSVGSGAEVLATLEKESFNILLTDMWMPGMNGMELAEKIRRSKKYPDLRIIVVTADTEAVSTLDTRFFDDVLVKPLTIDKLQHCIRKFTSNVS